MPASSPAASPSGTASMPSTRPETASLPIVFREKSLRRAARTLTRYRSASRGTHSGGGNRRLLMLAALERGPAGADLAAERRAIGGRGRAEHPGEVLTQNGCRAETALVRD